MPRSVPVLLLLLSLALPVFGQSAITPGGSMLGYGRSLAVSDGVVYVAEPLNQHRSGVVYVYRPGEGGAWEEAAALAADDADTEDQFGYALAVHGDRLLTTSLRKEGGRGAAYVFERGADGAWRQTARLVREDVGRQSGFGRAVALHGDVALVAAAAHDERRGAVFVYRRADDGWAEAGVLMPDSVAAGGVFGAGLAFDGRTALVGGRDAVWAFRWDADAGAFGAAERFAVGPDGHGGSVLALDGDAAVVGAARTHDRMGAVYVVERAADGTWSEAAVLRPFDGRPGDGFGSALALAGGELLVGAPGADGHRGAVYAYRRGADAAWRGAARLEVPARAWDAVGGSLAAEGDLAVAVRPGADHGVGSAVVLHRGADGWTAGAELMSETWTSPPAVTGGRVRCEDGRAAGFDCDGVDVVSFLPLPAIGGTRGVRMNDVWGWTDPQTGREYVLAGRVDGTSIVDISDPANPVYLGDLPMTPGARGNKWRDIKVYADHAFVVADNAGDHGMQVLDLRQLRDVQNPPVVFEPTALYTGITSAHNVIVNEETGFAYVVGANGGGDTCGGGLHMVDVREPANPTFAGCFADATTGRRRTGASHDAQCVVYRGPDADYQGREICFGSNETALSIADVTDKGNPVALAAATYPNVAYTHQGWLTEDQAYFYMNDELDEVSGTVDGTRTIVWDVSDLDDPVVVAEHVAETTVSDHNLYIRGDLMYQSNYADGLRILDISDRERPVEVGFFDPVAGRQGPGFNGSWSNYPFFESGVVVITSKHEGLFVLQKQDVGL